MILAERDQAIVCRVRKGNGGATGGEFVIWWVLWVDRLPWPAETFYSRGHRKQAEMRGNVRAGDGGGRRERTSSVRLQPECPADRELGRQSAEVGGVGTFFSPFLWFRKVHSLVFLHARDKTLSTP